jgi:hypothetical protein
MLPSYPQSQAEVSDKLMELVYEMLDAHDDTACLAAEEFAYDERWQAHLAYLRDLQRVGREMLAQAADSAGPRQRPRMHTLKQAIGLAVRPS